MGAMSAASGQKKNEQVGKWAKKCLSFWTKFCNANSYPPKTNEWYRMHKVWRN